MIRYEDLKLKALGIGSLPHNNLLEAMDLIKENFSEIPFFPQLANINKNEDMIIQIMEGLPSFLPSEAENFSIDSDSEEFFNSLEEFYCDYEEIISDITSENLEKYAITPEFSSSFSELEKLIKNTKPNYAKGQVAGPFTVSTALFDKNGKALIYDDTLQDVVVKLLSLKVLWQVRRIRLANPKTVPIIFIDEPTLSQLGTSAYLTVSENRVVEMLKTLVDIIKNNGGICAIHCCGKCDWSIPIKAGVDIINLDGYDFGEHLSIFSSDVEKFLQAGGKIAWGIVPTLDSSALDRVTIENLVELFENCVKYLTIKGIDEKLIIDNSLITSSCGAGSLSVENAKRAMRLVSELSNKLRERF